MKFLEMYFLKPKRIWKKGSCQNKKKIICLWYLCKDDDSSNMLSNLFFLITNLCPLKMCWYLMYWYVPQLGPEKYLYVSPIINVSVCVIFVTNNYVVYAPFCLLQFCADTECSKEDLVRAMDDKEEWCKRAHHDDDHMSHEFWKITFKTEIKDVDGISYYF